MATNAAKGIADWTRRLALTDEEAEELVEAARQEGRPVTNMIRQFVRAGLRSRKRETA